jgi:hypothetical protein
MKKEIRPVKKGVAVSRFQFVETGLYRNISNGVDFERPSIKGRRTWRSLDTANLKHAREELHRRRAGVSHALLVKSEPAAVTLGDILRRYQKDGYPDRQKQPRLGRTLELEKRNCSVLLKFWDKVQATEICLVECDRYHEWRRKHATKGRGDRAVDMEFNTLSNAVLWAMRCDLIRQNPLNFRRPRYCCAKNVRHCREFMPHDTAALHEIAALMFADTRAETLGWQMMFEAFTGLRTCEALRLSGRMPNHLRQNAGPAVRSGVERCLARNDAHYSAYRWHLNDPIVFNRGIKVTFEHFGWTSPDENPNHKSMSWNEREDDYSSVAFW